MVNYLSIDFESWAYPNLPKFLNLSSQERKKVDGGFVKKSAEKILELLAEYNTKITFFVLGELYEWYPKTIEMIASEGHEIGYHTHTHDILTSKEVLIDTLKRSKVFLKKFKPQGFRAPTILSKKDYLKILAAHGFTYDSSIYGSYELKQKVDGITQIPVTSWHQMPIGSGYFLGLLGKRMSFLYQQINNQGDPLIAFVHNWQIVKPKKATFPTWRHIATHPYYLPYCIEIDDVFKFLLQNFTFAPMRELVI